MGLIKKLGVLATIAALGINPYVNAQETEKVLRDTTVIDHGLNLDSIPTLVITKYFGDTAIEKEEYLFMGDKYQLTYEKGEKSDTSGRKKFETEVVWGYNEETEKVSDYEKNKLPTNFEERIQRDKFREFTRTRLFHYDTDTSRRLTEIVTTEKQGEEEPRESREYYFYPGKDNQPMKWADNNNDGKLNEEEILMVYDSDKEKWIEFEPKKEEPLGNSKIEESIKK